MVQFKIKWTQCGDCFYDAFVTLTFQYSIALGAKQSKKSKQSMSRNKTVIDRYSHGNAT